MNLLIEQLLNGLQFGVMLFLLAAGLTLIFGIMNVINLAHGAIYMIGAFVAATVALRTGSFAGAVLAGALAAGVLGIAIEVILVRRLYARDHLDQVLATFGLILLINEGAAIIWGRTPQFMTVPAALGGSIAILPGVPYPIYRLFIIAVGLAVAAGLYILIARTRIGMLIRAGATHRDLVGVFGVNVVVLYTFVFGLGALLAGLAGAVVAPVLAVQVGMGEQILILAFVVVVVGGLGSVRGAFVAALAVAVIDTLGRAYIPMLLKGVFNPQIAEALGAGLSSVSVYIFMALVLIWRPQGLFPIAQR